MIYARNNNNNNILSRAAHTDTHTHIARQRVATAGGRYFIILYYYYTRYIIARPPRRYRALRQIAPVTFARNDRRIVINRRAFNDPQRSELRCVTPFRYFF